ncbi:MAG: family 10 glycosylhydrolase [Muribaculaceae bacterium]|nr:family 10 glycosylhydrolase [Muribaculaceae bacterium]
MRKIILTFLAFAAVSVGAIAENPKHEFRGAWMHTVFQGQYAKQSTAENKAYLRDQLDKLKAAGVNAVVFQVRPQADALYPSELEPWSRHLTGKAGVAPSPMWDPLQFMIEESHARGMELHAWLNPYRVTCSKNEKLPANHLYHKEPKRFVMYDGKMYFDPGLPENRKFIEQVVEDIILRYDVDAIHMDDYFYPYPAKGEDFPDKASYKKYGNGMEIGDWRRNNVDQLIEGLHKSIMAIKPWVRLGISPFGVWRNQKSDPKGSDTNALTNYDDLYANVILWTEKGWVDYMLPQLYWELEHPRASSLTLVKWWNDNANRRHMYIGQDVMKTMDKPDLAPSTDANQLAHKINLTRELPDIQGNCWWPAYSITRNFKNVADSLAANQQSTIALVPSYPWIDSVAPAMVQDLKLVKQDDKSILSWTKVNTVDALQEQHSFAIYCFDKGSKISLDDSRAIIGVSYVPLFVIPSGLKGDKTFVVTAIDRANNESMNGVKLECEL